MKKIINKFALLTLGLAAVLICSQAISAQRCRPTPAETNTELGATIWQLTAIEGNAVDTDKATIEFNFEKNQIGGKGGCNGFGGLLERDGDKIKISQIISTKMFCEDGSDLENKYLSTLEKVDKLKVSGDELQLISDGKIVLEFVLRT